MGDFDFENYNPVGYVDILPNGNAHIEIVGYVSLHTIYHELTPSERIELFPPKGRVFAHNFIQKYEDLNKRLVCLAVLPNENEGDNRDGYVWDKSRSVYEFGDRIYSIKSIINEDGNNNFNIFQENNLIDIDEDKYILSGDKVIYIKSRCKDRLFPYWKVSNINIIKTQHGKDFLVRFQLPEKDGIVDITNDEQLINWFLSKILKKHWSKIKTADSYNSVEQFLTTAFNDMKNLTPNIQRSRLDRIKQLNANIILTLEELSDIMEIPWVNDMIKRSIDTYKESLLSDLTSDYEQQLERIKEEHETLLEEERYRYKELVKKNKADLEFALKSIADEKALVMNSLEERKLDIEILEETILSKKEEITQLNELIDIANERKEGLKSDFSIIKEVLNIENVSKPIKSDTPIINNNKNIIIQFLNETNTECIMFEAFGKSLEKIMKLNKLPHLNASTIAETLAVYNLLIMPKITFAMSIIHSTQKCYYGIEYVNVGWKSFEDLWNEGLRNMVDHCSKEPAIMHYLILQNINMSYLPNYLQPLLDIQIGLTKFLPTGIEYPKNLRILCTLTNEDVIPLSEECIKYIGCLEKPSNEEFDGKFIAQYDERYGYLSPSNILEKSSSNPTNYYKSYINE